MLGLGSKGSCADVTLSTVGAATRHGRSIMYQTPSRLLFVKMAAGHSARDVGLRKPKLS